MKSLQQLCTPRDSVFDSARRDTVLNLTHLAEDKIPAGDFFEESYVTEGMHTLLTEAFRRLQGQSGQAVFKLTQAMGGGKTHNLITLGMLAKHPEQRATVLPELPSGEELPAVRVVAFSGRETDVAHGLWGEIAKQLGKFDFFRDYYQPLRAPGRSAWINLLKDCGPTLILLDELPPYLDNARSFAIGSSDLSKVTATALTNLFEALADDQVHNVCVVLTDLVGTYAEASAQIGVVLSQLQDEARRFAMDLTPVRMNTDEFYHILRRRLFKTLPTDADVDDVAQGYAKAVRDAKQMDITAQSPEQFGQLVKSSYPFHPAIKDLYARFRENPGFQQTRALIRLMRIVAARLWQSGEAETELLIGVHGIDLNDPDTLSEVRQINSSLENAVSHDIAAGGKAVAEIMDANLGGHDARDSCRLLFMASLANVPDAVIGLSVPDLVGYLCAPGRNLARLKGDVLEKLSTAAWYLHSNRDGKLYFRNVENLNAKLESLARGYIRQQSFKELRDRLGKLFEPVNKWCYQTVLALPTPDEIELSPDRTTLVISEPLAGQDLNPQLREFWEQTTFKNRVAFLTGSRNTFDGLLDSVSRLKAIQYILSEMEKERVPTTDPQFTEADALRDRVLNSFLSAVKETFTVLHYPTRQNNTDTLAKADFLMKFTGNDYRGEDQVVQTLRDKQKYTEEVSGDKADIFRKKVETRLFTTETMLWSEVKKRAATNPQWQWHRPDALDALCDDLTHREIWRENGGYVDRRPPPPKAVGVQIQERSRDDATGRVELKVAPIHGDTVFVETGGEATPASQRVDGGLFTTDAMQVSFLGVDSTGVHTSGPTVEWKNRVTLKHRFFIGSHGERMLELQAAPDADHKAVIRYTTDGSDPKLAGGTYAGPTPLPPGTLVVLAYGEREGISSAVLTFPVPTTGGAGGGGQEGDDVETPVDPVKPAVWSHTYNPRITAESYEFIERLKRHEARIAGIRIGLTGSDGRWLDLSFHEEVELDAAQVTAAVESLRALPVSGSGQVEIVSAKLHFPQGQRLLDWANEVKTDLKSGEIKQ